MKVVAMFLDEVFPPDARVEREASALVEAGYEVHLWAFTFNSKKHGQVRKHNTITVHYCYPGILTIKFGALANDFPFYTYFLKKNISSFIKKVNPDILHINDIRIAPVVYSVRSREKIVLDLHENRPEIMRFYPHLRRFPGKYLVSPRRWKNKEIDFVKNADAVITVTEESRQHYLDYNSNIYVVTNSLSLKEFSKREIYSDILEKYQDSFTLLYIGDLGLRRGIMEAIKAVDHLRKEIKDVKLVLVGGSTDRNLYEKEIENKGLKDHVVFEGFKDPKYLPSYIKAAKIGLSPLHRNPHHDTTYANKLFQYMALGLPQVVSDCPSQANLISSTHAGLVHKAGNAEDLAEKLMDLYNSKDLREKISQDSISAMVNTWDWDKKKGNLLELYKIIM